MKYTIYLLYYPKQTSHFMCSENPSGGTPPIDYEEELKAVVFDIENVKYLMGI